MSIPLESYATPQYHWKNVGQKEWYAASSLHVWKTEEGGANFEAWKVWGLNMQFFVAQMIPPENERISSPEK